VVVKWSGCMVDHSPPSTAKVKNEWSYTSVLPAYLHTVGRDKFTLLHFLSLCGFVICSNVIRRKIPTFPQIFNITKTTYCINMAKTVKYFARYGTGIFSFISNLLNQKRQMYFLAA
jgi:hypothetical protein